MVPDGAVWVQKAVVTEGTTNGLICDWSANLVGAAYWRTNVKQTFQVIVKRDGGTFGFGTFSMPAGTELGSKTTDTGGWKVPTPTSPSPYEASSTTKNYGTAFKSSYGPLHWTSVGAGPHTFECVVPKTGFEEPNLSNNIATAFVEVLPKIKVGDSRGAPGGMKAAPGTAAALAKPNLSVVGHQAIVEPNCQSPKPAMTVKVTIRNSGGPLPANKGTVFAKEFGGASLSSAGIRLPELTPGQQQVVDIPVMSLQPYSTLAGGHQLQVKFNPVLEGGQLSFVQPTAPYMVNAAFPANHCMPASPQRPGAASGSAESPGRLPGPTPPPRLRGR